MVSGTARSVKSYEDEIARLTCALSAECANSKRLADRLGDAAEAWRTFNQQELDRLLLEDS